MSGDMEVKTSGRVKIFETLLSSPGMNEPCKVVIKPSRKTILILNRLVEWMIKKERQEMADEILAFLSLDAFAELEAIALELLKKGELEHFYEQLKTW